MSAITAYPRELEQRQLYRHQYCRGCCLFLKHAKQQDPMLLLHAGLPPNVYGHPVLILATHVKGIALNCVRVAVITSRGGRDATGKWAHEYLPIWPKAATSPDSPQLFLGEGRTLPKESYVCLRNTFDFDCSMLVHIRDPTDSYHYHLTRESFNIVAERLQYPLMKLLDDPTLPGPMNVPPVRREISLTRTADLGKCAGPEIKARFIEHREAAHQSNTQEEKQWMREYLQRRMTNPERVAQCLAVWQKNNNIGSGMAVEHVKPTLPGRRDQAISALSRPPENRSRTPQDEQQPEPLSPRFQVHISHPRQSLTPESVQDLRQRLQTLSPPQLMKETHHTTKPKGFGSKNPFTRLRHLEHAQRSSQRPIATPMLSLYDFIMVSLMLLSGAAWFFLKVFVILTHKFVVWLLLVLASKAPRKSRVWINEMTAATEERLLFLAAEGKKTVTEVLDKQQGGGNNGWEE